MRFLWETIKKFSDDSCIELAAAIAFYTILSLAPLVVLIIMIAGLFVEPEAIQGKVAQTAVTILGNKGAQEFKTVTGEGRAAAGGLWAKIVNIVILLVGATGVMVQIQSALDRIWRVGPAVSGGIAIKRFVLTRVFSIAMILSLAFLLLLSLALTPAILAATRPIANLLGSGILRAIDSGVTVVTIAVLFAAMFKMLPKAPVSWKHACSGAAVTAVLFAAGKFLIGLYLGRERLGSMYGAASSVVFILLWTYYSALIFLFGAELAQAWDARSKKGTPTAAR